MLDTNSTHTGQSMPPSDPREQSVSVPSPADTADSFQAALDYNRRERASFLDYLFVTDLPVFGRVFAKCYEEDCAIATFISKSAAEFGLTLVTPREVQ